MSVYEFFVELLFHLDTFLVAFTDRYGILVYLLVFVILFFETGLFVPFLPGDSLIFACAAFAAAGHLDIWVVILVCFTSAFLGDALNYYLGHSIGRRLYQRGKGKFINPANVDKARAFYERHGGKAIVLSRYIPLVRQCTPFVAGIGKMTYRKFMTYNLAGVTLWVGGISTVGYFFGNIPAVSDNFSGIIIGIVFISLLPALFLFIKSKLLARNP